MKVTQNISQTSAACNVINLIIGYSNIFYEKAYNTSFHQNVEKTQGLQ